MRTEVRFYSVGSTPISRFIDDLPGLELASMDEVEGLEKVYCVKAYADVPGVKQVVYVQIDGVESILGRADPVKSFVEGLGNADPYFQYLFTIEQQTGIEIAATMGKEGKFLKHLTLVDEVTS